MVLFLFFLYFCQQLIFNPLLAFYMRTDLIKRFSAVVVSLLCLSSAHAETIEYGLFNHLGVGVSLGTGGLGFDVAAPVASWGVIRVGMSSTFNESYSTDVEFETDSKSIVTNRTKDNGKIKVLNVEGKINIHDFKMLLDIYPSRNSAFHFTAGAFYGPKTFLTVYNTEPFLAEKDWGTAGYMLGDYKISTDEKGKAEASIEVSGFKPYFGVGFGRSVPTRHRIHVTCDFGVKLWGEPAIYTWSTDKWGDRQYTELTKEGVNNTKYDEFFDIKSMVTVYPVINIRICGRIF